MWFHFKWLFEVQYYYLDCSYVWDPVTSPNAFVPQPHGQDSFAVILLVGFLGSSGWPLYEQNTGLNGFWSDSTWLFITWLTGPPVVPTMYPLDMTLWILQRCSLDSEQSATAGRAVLRGTGKARMESVWVRVRNQGGTCLVFAGFSDLSTEDLREYGFPDQMNKLWSSW